MTEHAANLLDAGVWLIVVVVWAGALSVGRGEVDRQPRHRATRRRP